MVKNLLQFSININFISLIIFQPISANYSINQVIPDITINYFHFNYSINLSQYKLPLILPYLLEI